MPKLISSYVKFVDTICIKVGRIVMYGVFFMMFVLILSFITRNIINYPLMWIIPLPIRNMAYKLISKNRKRFFKN